MKKFLLLMFCAVTLLTGCGVKLGESMKIKADCEAAGRPLTFVDIESDDKKVAHVHNVTSIDLPESKQVNAAMVDFMINCL